MVASASVQIFSTCLAPPIPTEFSLPWSLSLLTLSMLLPPVARECPNVGSGGGGGRGGFGGGGGGGGGAMSGKCFVCGGVGHLARECPSGGSGGGGDEGRCVQDVNIDIVVA